ncbi:MAG: flagellar export protein FliJ [Desulfobulbaceae bacterium]|nr:flagellar export protein FliJ [Desulfobulbaceae bacterium]HIJ78910.1 flagellar export protein FliJ [Deltaproteobacteria bacterium]
MAYHFKLDTVLMLRRNLEEVAQQKLAKELLVLDAHSRRLAEVKKAREDLIAEFEQKKKAPMNPAFFSFYMNSISRREQEIEGVLQLIANQQKAVAKARHELAERVKGKKVMEKAKERDYQKYQHEELRKEQNEADEQMVLRFGRQDNG